jgi:hypothetical protein
MEFLILHAGNTNDFSHSIIDDGSQVNEGLEILIDLTLYECAKHTKMKIYLFPIFWFKEIPYLAYIIFSLELHKL